MSVWTPQSGRECELAGAEDCNPKCAGIPDPDCEPMMDVDVANNIEGDHSIARRFERDVPPERRGERLVVRVRSSNCRCAVNEFVAPERLGKFVGSGLTLVAVTSGKSTRGHGPRARDSG